RYRVAEHLVEAAAADLRAAGESADSHELEARDGGGRRGASRYHEKLPGTLDEQPDRRSARGNECGAAAAHRSDAHNAGDAQRTGVGDRRADGKTTRRD